MRDVAGPGAALLREGLRGAGRPLLELAAWSAVEAGPALGSGWVLSVALNRLGG